MGRSHLLRRVGGAFCILAFSILPSQALELTGEVSKQGFSLDSKAEQTELQEQFPNLAPVPLNSGTNSLNIGTNHGSQIWGCLGCLVDARTGIITSVLPGSQASGLVMEGDQILEVFGHRYNASTLVEECRGIPGTIIPLKLAHHGPNGINFLEVGIPRSDARNFLQYNYSYQQTASRNRFW